MTRCTVAAIMAGLITVNAYAAGQDVTAQIKTLQKERVEVLSKLVEIHSARYRLGIIGYEAAARTN